MIAKSWQYSIKEVSNRKSLLAYKMDFLQKKCGNYLAND